MVSLVAPIVKASALKCLPTTRETQVPSLGQEDPLEKEMATHCSILAWKSHGQRNLVGYSPWGCKRVRQAILVKAREIPAL